MRIRSIVLLLACGALMGACDDKGGGDSGLADDTGGVSSSDDTGGASDADADGDGYSAALGDCDDDDADVNPGADEICDGLDNDCDGETDEDPVDASTGYADADGDGYGDPGTAATVCDGEDGYSADGSDCDDGDADVHPGADERCDGRDDDCDDDVDEGAVDADTWYWDFDGDGYGDPDEALAACEAPSNYVSDDQDCDDLDAGNNPGEDELCDDEDNDCDGETDEDDAADALTWYADADADGYGDPGTADVACEAPDGFLSDATDCDDADDAVNPGAEEICDDVDNDCDGDVDVDAVDADTWYEDADGDGYGNASVSASACEAPSGYVSDRTDCDDGDAAITDDTCDSATWDGTYTGTFDVDVTVASFGVSDTCEGEVEIEVDEGASGTDQLDGVGVCEFIGVLGSLLPGEQSGLIDGELTSASDVEGELSVGGIITETWSGSFSGDTLEGTFSGSTSYHGFDITYSGEFSAER